jgi:diamine N-acetyltransferase
VSPLPFAAVEHDLGVAQLCPAAPFAADIGAMLAGMDPWKRGGRTAALMADRFSRNDPSAYRFAICVDLEPVGAVMIRYPFMRGPYLETLGLAETARGRGIGDAVIDWMAREVQGQAANMWLCVSDWNGPARRFYARMGFEEIGPIPDLAVAGVDEIFMRKRI